MASEPMESHVFFAEHFYDAVNGLYTTLTTFSVCNATPAGGSSSSAALPSHPRHHLLLLLSLTTLLSRFPQAVCSSRSLA